MHVDFQGANARQGAARNVVSAQVVAAGAVPCGRLRRDAQLRAHDSWVIFLLEITVIETEQCPKAQFP